MSIKQSKELFFNNEVPNEVSDDDYDSEEEVKRYKKSFGEAVCSEAKMSRLPFSKGGYDSEEEVRQYNNRLKQNSELIVYEDKPPDYLDNDIKKWEMINFDEIEKIEKEQIHFIKNIIEETLYLEFLQSIDLSKKPEWKNEKQALLLQIMEDINIDFKYKTLHITIKKKKPWTINRVLGIMRKTVGDIILTHPLKTLGVIGVAIILI